MARIVRFHEFGSADVLRIEDIPTPEPGPGEVRMKVEAIGLNRAEILFHEGRYLEKPLLPSKIGYEAAGTVEAVGPGVSGINPGDKISAIPTFSMSKYGVYGDTAIIPAKAAAPYPSNLSVVEAASIWMQYFTAYGALVEIGKMTKGDFVVITAASSSVGYAAIEIANAVGAIPIATTRTSAKKQALIDGGAAHVIVTNDERLPKRVAEITGDKGARLIFDAIAGPVLHDLAKCAAYEGTIFVYGALSLSQTPFPVTLALNKGLNIRGYTMFEIINDDGRFERTRKFIFDALQSGKLKPVIDSRTFRLEEIADAHRYMETNQHNGKIVVTVS